MLKITIGDSQFVFPVFKFLSARHAQSLIGNGSGRIVALRDFRNTTKYGGMIQDPLEGILQIRNYYSHYSGLSKDANGLLPLKARSPYEHIDIFDVTLTDEIQFPASFVYCITQHLFSDSVLQWASERHKDACVLIRDMEEFESLVTRALPIDARQLGFDRCSYVGRTVDETNPGAESLTNYMLTHRVRANFVKPKEYADQRELRAVWMVDSCWHDYIDFAVPEISRLCYQVDYSSIREAISRGATVAELSFGARIHRKDTSVAEYILDSPPEICSPILSKEGSEPWRLGFWYGRTKEPMNHPKCNGADIGLCMSKMGPIFALVDIDEVQRVELHCQPKT